MNLNLLSRSWIVLSIVLLGQIQATAQCVPPTSLWLQPAQSSTDFSVKWTPLPGASQHQLRYWPNSDPANKTIVDDVGFGSFILRGLKKNTSYSIQVRAKCGADNSDWTPAVLGMTANSSGSCNPVLGASAVKDSNSIIVSWSSSGIHALRYRMGSSGDWLIPSGAMVILSPPFVISNLLPGNYQVELKRNCSSTGSDYTTFQLEIAGNCLAPQAPVVHPGITDALVDLPDVANVLGYNVEYSAVAGTWTVVGQGVPAPNYLLNPPLSPSSPYQVRIQAVCATSSSDYSPPAIFTTGAFAGSCLPNKDFGKNLSAADLLQIQEAYNKPSPFPFGEMIGVNDGGLIFRSFQFENANQITQLTKRLRIFHTMDEDFNANLVDYAQNTKPKDTNPEGTPAHTDRNKNFYTKYRLTHGFEHITSATEILQYSPQTWKEKIYQESDWSLDGPAGIMGSYKNYTKTFIDEFAPASGGPQLATGFQVGNEPWDYPIKSDYHSLLAGARAAFVEKYGPKSSGGWKMNFAAAAFQAYRENTCASFLRDFSNCGGDLERHDFIGDYLDVADCSILQDLDAIDCHPYSFAPGTTHWTYPEDAASEGLQIINLAGWLLANQNPSAGILQHTRLWSTEYGFDSNPLTGVGEKTQAAYLLRGLMLHSRFHFERVFFYNAFDIVRPADPSYSTGLYNSTGFWKMGTHPLNNAWPSPLEAHGATPKPAWHAMLDFKERFGEHVFFKALLEDEESYVILLAKPDSTDPYLLFWSPVSTNDGNINQDVALDKPITWAGILPQAYSLETNIAQCLRLDTGAGENFEAISAADCESASLASLRRMPAFIRLLPCPPDDGCAKMENFERIAHNIADCNDAGDHYFELKLSQINQDEQIDIVGLPENGINVPMSLLNGGHFDAASFQANLTFVSSSQFRWQVEAANGQDQSLRLFYCWASDYPDPISATRAVSLCNGITLPCSEGDDFSNPGIGEERGGEVKPSQIEASFQLQVNPNPGIDRLVLSYSGQTADWARLQIVGTTGQTFFQKNYAQLESQQSIEIDTQQLPSGLFFVGFQTETDFKWLIWEKL